MICAPCKNERHDECPGTSKDKTWCDCQHREPKKENK